MVIKEERNKKLSIFVLKFCIIFGILLFVLETLPFYWLQNAIADVEASTLGLKNEGNQIIVSAEQSFIIDRECTGLISIFTLASVVFALRRPEIKNKMLLFGAGAIALFVINIIRIYFLLWAGMLFGFAMIELAHVATWFVMAFAVIALWYVLTKKVAGIKKFEELI